MILDLIELLKYTHSGWIPFFGTLIYLVIIGGISLQGMSHVADAVKGLKKGS